MANEETDFIARLFAEEIPEIAAGIVEIKAIARKPGSRTKLALQSHDPRMDCVGACVGVRGARIRKIVDVLGGERIDLFRWHESPERLIATALLPAVIAEVILHPAQHRAVVVVKADQVALVTGRRGENRELASRLCGWQIEVKER
jgi:transcription termination/antitermination protein NusA